MWYAISAALITALAIPALARIAPSIGLIDHPDQVRKLHEGAIPLVGGPAILIALIAVLLIATGGALQPWIPLTTLAIAATLIGAFDDKHDIHAGGRLLGQLLLAGVAVFVGGVSITHFGDLIGNGSQLPLHQLGPWIALGALAAAMNAYNMLDGTDGQCASLALIPTLALIGTALATGNTPPVVLYILAGALPVFVLFNLQPLGGALPKCFLGDSGATLLGLLVGWMLITAAQGPDGWLRPVTVLWLAAMPLFDTLFVMAYRALHGRSPLSADRNHIHYLLKDHGFSRIGVLLTVSAISITMAAIGLTMEFSGIPEYVAFGGIFLLFLIYLPVAIHLHRSRDRQAQEELLTASS